MVSIITDTFEKLLLKLYGNRNNADEIIRQLPEQLREKVCDKKSLLKEFVWEFGKSFAGTSGERAANLLFDVIVPVSLLRRFFGN